MIRSDIRRIAGGEFNNTPRTCAALILSDIKLWQEVELHGERLVLDLQALSAE
jgi:hypothetical protein